MQNTATMALRAVILLICLVAVPVFAIFGKSAPDVIKALVQNYLTGSSKSGTTTASPTDSPVFRPGLMAPTSTSESPFEPPTMTGGIPAGAGWIGQEPGPLGGNQGPVPNSKNPTAALNGESAAKALPAHNPPAPLTDIPGPAGAQPRPIVGRDAGSLVSGYSGVRTIGSDPDTRGAVIATTSHQRDETGAPPGRDAGSQSAANVKSIDSADGRFSPNYFRAAEKRLRDLGATYYLLETLGPEGNHYRFFCKVAAGRKAEQTAFFATDNDPLAAMNNVVRQVEGWRAHVPQ